MFEFFATFIPLIRTAVHADGFLNWDEDSGPGLPAFPHQQLPHTHTGCTGPSSTAVTAKSSGTHHAEG